MLSNLNFRFDIVIIILIIRVVNTKILKFRIIFTEVFDMTFAENLKRICDERGTTPTALCKELGLSTSKVSAWYGGSLPKQDVMVTLAKKLDCSVMDFFYDGEDGEQILIEVMPARKDEDLADILRIYAALSRRDKHDFMSMVYEFEKRGGDKE